MQVQQEDVALCEAVQRGLRSPAYDCGRYDHVLLHLPWCKRLPRVCMAASANHQDVESTIPEAFTHRRHVACKSRRANAWTFTALHPSLPMGYRMHCGWGQIWGIVMSSEGSPCPRSAGDSPEGNELRESDARLLCLYLMLSGGHTD